ncbi:hypothetical protein HID58_044003 [Brassica napus]|uniref:Uncharacterized protein n=1 Tax=Brassica napus TaxID=3708 RepID=A0ABQ8BI87_BRANA|nr:hypothetical protein HID58_044003 [Brassica napus]
MTLIGFLWITVVVAEEEIERWQRKRRLWPWIQT